MHHKLFFFLGLAALFFATPVGAQSGKPPIPNLPASNNYVLDTLNWLSESQEQEINTIARQFFHIIFVMLNKSLTARVTRLGWEGESLSKRDSTQARKKLKKRGAYPKSGARIVRQGCDSQTIISGCLANYDLLERTHVIAVRAIV